MGTIYVRNLDARTHAILEKKAAERGSSLSELIRNILQNYTVTADLNGIDDKYRAFVSDMLTLYKIEIEEVRRESQLMMKQLMDKLQRDEELHDEIKQLLMQKSKVF